MSQFTKQQLLDGLHNLPPEIQEIVLSMEQADAFYEIMEKHDLTVAQIAAVADALAPITFGLVVPKELPSELRRSLPTLPSSLIDALVTDINTKLLAPIRMHVMEAAHQAKNPLIMPSTSKSIPAAAQTPLTAPIATNIPQTLGADITRAKMEGTFRLEPDTVTVKIPSQNPIPTVPKPAPVAPVRDGKYASADPYREPTE